MRHDAMLLEPAEPGSESGPEVPPRRVPGVPRALITASELSWRLLACTAGVAVVAYLIWQVRFVVLPVLVAALIATILVPPARVLRRRGLGAGPATALVCVFALLVLVLVFAVILPPVVGELDALTDQVRAGADDLGRRVADLGLGVSQADVEGFVEGIDDRLRQNSGRLTSGALTASIVIGQVAAGILLTLVLVFFFVKDGSRLWDWVVRLFPRGGRPAAEAVGATSWRILGGYMRGVATVATFDAACIGLALIILGVPLAIPLTAVTFLAAFFPIVGAFLAGLAAALVALVGKGLVAAIIVVVVCVVVQQLEGNLIYPVLVGRTVELHPVAILLAVAIGGVVAGLIGAFAAVPLVAVVSAAVPAGRRARAEAARPGVSAETAGERAAAAVGA